MSVPVTAPMEALLAAELPDGPTYQLQFFQDGALKNLLFNPTDVEAARATLARVGQEQRDWGETLCAAAAIRLDRPGAELAGRSRRCRHRISRNSSGL